MTMKAPKAHAKKVGFILLRVFVLATIVHFVLLGLDHTWILAKFGKEGEILIGCLADHFTFGWE